MSTLRAHIHAGKTPAYATGARQTRWSTPQMHDTPRPGRSLVVPAPAVHRLRALLTRASASP